MARSIMHMLVAHTRVQRKDIFLHKAVVVYCAHLEISKITHLGSESIKIYTEAFIIPKTATVMILIFKRKNL